MCQVYIKHGGHSGKCYRFGRCFHEASSLVRETDIIQITIDHVYSYMITHGIRTMEEQDEVPRGQKNRVPEELWSLYPQRIEEIIALEDTEEIPLE